MGCPLCCLGVKSMVPIFMGDNLLSIPELRQYPAYVWSSAVDLQCRQESTPVQSVIFFAKFL